MFTGLFIDSFQIAPYIELSKADLVWSVAAGPGLNYSPNVLSELSFEDLKARGGGFTISHINKLNDKVAFYIEGDIASSDISTGSARDSDYFGDNRTEEFSRSYSKTKGDGLKKKLGAMGFKYRWMSNRGHYVSVLIGMSDFQYDINMKDGVQYIPIESRGIQLTGLDSTYDSIFKSEFIALMSEHAFPFGTLGLRIEQHKTEFDAKANWNLRQDLAHPISFAQTGEGDGYVVVLGYSYAINTSWDVYLNIVKRNYVISDAYDHIFMREGSSVVTRLNEVDYEDYSSQAGFRYIF